MAPHGNVTDGLSSSFDQTWQVTVLDSVELRLRDFRGSFVGELDAYSAAALTCERAAVRTRRGLAGPLRAFLSTQSAFASTHLCSQTTPCNTSLPRAESASATFSVIPSDA